MGVVYRAEDSQLHRTVAIKFLGRSLANDADHRARFLREARVAAGLNHPNICTIHDVGELRDELPLEQGDRLSANTPYIAMEYIDGEPVSALISRSAPLAPSLLVDIGLQIARGLAVAHGEGVVHRDLKPGNVGLTRDGRAKILDFGLAEVVLDERPDEAVTMLETRPSSGSGFAGTVAYMSPEQADGRPVDRRSDVFAFGTMLYEMASGQRPFAGAASETTLAQIRAAAPAPLAQTAPTLPPRLAQIIHRCLEKDPARRYNDTRDLVLDLEAVDLTPPAASRPVPHRRRVLAAGLAVIALGSVLAGALWMQPDAPLQSTTLIPSQRQVSFSGYARLPELSPDGQFIAYWDRLTLRVQDLSGGNPIDVFKGTPFFEPRWSPDGSQLLVPSMPSLSIVPRLGGSARPLGDLGLTFADWLPDGLSVGGIRVGDLVVRRLDDPSADLATRCDLNASSWGGLDWSSSNLVALAFATKDGVRTLSTLDPTSCRANTISTHPSPDVVIGDVQWAPDLSALYYTMGPGLWKAPVAPDGRLTGPPRLVRDGVMDEFSISAARAGGFVTTRLAYTVETRHENLVVASPDGTTVPVTQGTSVNTDPAISPDSTRVAFVRQGNIFVGAITGGPVTAVTTGFQNAWRPTWSPDGRKIAFLSNGNDGPRIWIVNVDDGSTRSHSEANGSALGRWLLWTPSSGVLFRDRQNGLSALDPDSGAVHSLARPWAGGRDPLGLLNISARTSRDGRRVVVEHENETSYDLYSLASSGEFVHERTLPAAGRAAGSVAGWVDPDWIHVWQPATREVWRIPVSGGAPVRVMALPPSLSNIVAVTPAPDGRRFVVQLRQSTSDVWLVENFDAGVESPAQP